MMKYLIKYDDDIKVNTTKNVNQQTGGKSENSIYLFKADWCGHCQKFKPIWNELREKYKNVNFIEYDGDDNQSLFQKWGISGIPTVIFRNGNNAVEHKGVKTIESMKDFINKFTKEGFENGQTGGSQSSNKPKITLYKAEWCGACNHFKPEWEKLRNKYTDLEYQTIDADSQSDMIPNDIKGFPTIMIEQNGERSEYVGQRKADAIKSFVDKNNKKLDSMDLIVGGKKTGKKLILFQSDECPHCRAFDNEWKKLQKNFKGVEYETFNNKKNTQEFKNWDIDGVPTIMYINKKSATEYVGERDAKAIIEFVKNN